MTDDIVPPSKPLAPPAHTPGYQVREWLAGNPQHAMWRAIRVHDGRPVVLKIPVAPQPTPLDIARLHHEVEITGLLPEDAVVRALSVERWDAGYALVIDDTGGTAMSVRISQQMAVRTVLELGLAVAGAVAAVHAHGVIHKDLNPANIIVDRDQHVRLTDFGYAVKLARETAREIAPKALEGTLAYMSPDRKSVV